MSKKKKFAALLQTAQQEVEHTEVYIKEHIEILDELRDLIRPLSDEEYKQLEQNILEEGCRDPLVVWKDSRAQRYVLIDGHHRYGICQRHKLPFKIELREFENIEAVKDWMVNNQLGKRNLTKEEMAYLRGYQYNRFKQKSGNIANLKQFAGQAEEQPKEEGSTAEKLANVFKVSDKTIKRDGQYAEGLDRLSEGMPGLKNKILKGELKVPAKVLRQVPKMSEAEVAQLRETLLQSPTKQAGSKNKRKTSPAPKKDKVSRLKAEVMQLLKQVEDETLLLQVKKLLQG
ncbi:ParB N-terminal domain-containing protein [Thermonema rossianum]|jgi:ParB-like chromosome segregation protein Spo0J|uniref:ParB N-terminal domain-containing protein n=1 Tax=Thermonema rossianum TaxID=55505 RepID=UPI00068D5759|nr:ParB N-terminal domain-containing protein [Thermonema rossianum]